MTLFRNSSLTLVALTMGLSACGGKGSADQSYCQSLCDWAVECAAAERDIDADALLTECIAATSAASGSCAEFDDGEMSKADELILADCNSDIGAKQTDGECGGFSGSVAEAEVAQPPATCNGLDGAQDAFDAAQSVVQEGSEEMCERVAESFCTKMASCIDESTGFDSSTIDDAPYDACMSALDGRVSECVTNDTYAADPANTQRIGAEECLADFEEVTCDEVLGGNMPPVCAAAFVNPADYSSEIFTIAQQYATGG
jgi:hypothetical protein